MDYAVYRKAFFVDPPLETQFGFSGLFGVALFFQPYDEAVAFYTRLLGPPAYVEGDNTRGWRIADSWLTLFPAREGNPSNAEITLLVDSPADVDRLRQAFVEAGGTGEEPFDDLMYEPLRLCPVADPFGTAFLIVARLEGDQ